jgi:hypothetical protein
VRFADVDVRFGGGGTFCPFSRASDIPIAIACLRLVTFLPDLPDSSAPLFFLRIALVIVRSAFFEYFAIVFTI